MIPVRHNSRPHLSKEKKPLSPHRRIAIVSVLCCVAIASLSLFSLTYGDYPLTVRQVLSTFFSDQGFANTVVLEWRLPRVIAATVFGAALGASGALFQTLTHNPLGSPDIIGFSTGAYTGAIISFTIAGNSVMSEVGGALIGGLLTAAVVYVLSWKQGVQGFRLIIVGIAITAMLSSLNTYLLLRTDTEVAMAASIWGAGSLSLVGWNQLLFTVPLLALLGIVTALLVPPLRQLELGDDAARAHGVPTEVTRLGILAVGVGLVALVTAVSGPIAFIALAAPQIAKRLTHSGGIPVGTASFMGAFLLLSADVIAQHGVPGSVPVGIVTVVIGGIYLVAVLVQEARKKL